VQRATLRHTGCQIDYLVQTHTWGWHNGVKLTNAFVGRLTRKK
jgi:hypothetical protein